MPKLKMELKGLDQLKAKFDQLDKQTQGAVLQNAVRAGALPIQNAAITKAPIRSGDLRRSIHTEIVNTSATHAEAEIGTDLEYAPFVEFGTRYMSAQPYLRPAFDTQTDAAKREIAAALKAQLDV